MKTAYTTFQKGMETGEIKLEREDHFDGENALYRLAAYIPRNANHPLEEDTEFRHLKDRLSELTVRPSRIFIHNSCYEIDWFPVGSLVVSSKVQYTELLLDFATYLDENSFDHEIFHIQTGSLSDDPLENISEIPPNEINFSPTFSPECFGNEGIIEVFDW